MTSPLPYDNQRILRLAGTPQSRPEITYTDQVLYKVIYGTGFVEEQDGCKDLTEQVPLMRYRRRLNTRTDALRLQLIYQTLHQRFGAITPYSQRLKLIQDCRYKDTTGALCTYVTGMVTDFEPVAGTIGRICLISPTVSNTASNPGTDPIDSHLWLMADQLDLDHDYTNPADQTPGLRNPGDPMGGDIRIGDMLTVAARINAYTDSHGRRRLGVGEWTPLCRSLLYVYEDADQRLTVRFVPRHLMKHLRIIRFQPDGTPQWANPHMLTRETERWHRKYPDATSQLKLTHDVKA